MGFQNGCSAWVLYEKYDFISNPDNLYKYIYIYIYISRGVNVQPNPQTRHEPDMDFFGLGLDFNEFGS